MYIKGVFLFFYLLSITFIARSGGRDSLFRANKVKSLLQKDCTIEKSRKEKEGEEEEYDYGSSCSATYTEYDKEGRVVYDHFLRMGSAHRYIYNGDTVYNLYDNGSEGIDTGSVEISKNGESLMFILYETKDTTYYSSEESKNGREVTSYSISKTGKRKNRFYYDNKKRCVKYEDFEFDKSKNEYIVSSRTFFVYIEKEGKEISYTMEGIKLTSVNIKITQGNKTENYKWYYDTPGEINYPHNGNIFTGKSYEIRDNKGRIIEELDFKFDPCWLPENYYITKYTYGSNGLTESAITTLENGKQVYSTSYEYSFFD